MPDMSTVRRYAAPGALVAAGVIAGAMLAGSLSARAADSQTATPSASASANSSTPSADPPKDLPSSGETPLTGTTADKVRAAVLAKYPGATIDRLETDAGGDYEAHITTKAGTRVTVEVSKAFAVTGEEQGGHGRFGGFGGSGDHMAPTQLTGTTATKVKAALLAKYPGATVRSMFADPRGGYAAFITTKDAKQLVVSLSTAFAVTEAREMSGGPGGRGGRGFGPGGVGGMQGRFGTELSGTNVAKVEAALLAKYPGATVFRMVSLADGTYRAVVDTKDGKRLLVTLDKAFKVTGATDAPTKLGHHDREAPTPTPSTTPSNSAFIS